MLLAQWNSASYTVGLFVFTLLYHVVHEFAITLTKWIRGEIASLTVAVYTAHAPLQELIEKVTPPFTPWLVMSGPVMQTFIPYVLSLFRRKPVRFYDKYVLTEDGALICLNYLSFDTNLPTFVCVPGISGDQSAHYIQNLVRDVCIPLGFNCVVFNKRRVAKSTSTPHRPFPSYTDEDDLAQALQTVAEDTKEIYLIGFSAGANMVIKYLGSSLGQCPWVRMAFSLSNGYDIRVTMQSMPLYCNRMMTLFNLLKLDVDVDISKCLTLQDMDKHMHGCPDDASLQEFYGQQSCFEELPSIRIPLFLINSLDDMLFLPEANQHAIHAADFNPNIILVFTNRGGHLGWFHPTNQSKTMCCA